MGARNQKTIWLRPEQYDKLKEIKAAYQEDSKHQMDWGDFLITLGLAYLVGKGLAHSQSADIQNSLQPTSKP